MRLDKSFSRRFLLSGTAASGGVAMFGRIGPATAAAAGTDVTFVFSCDVHACRTSTGLSPNCLEEGKTDANLIRHVTALNALAGKQWPTRIGGAPSGLASAGQAITPPSGLVIGGDMTDDGGGQEATAEEGSQLLQFSQRYQEGAGEGRIHFPVYAGLGNHDLDQDGAPPRIDWYRRELRDYVEFNHRPSVFFKPTVPADNYDVESDCYSWNWGGLHLVQAHRFMGDTNKDAASGLNWLRRDLATYARNGRPVVLFQHYGWDPFSVERWDPSKVTFDDAGTGAPHWWTDEARTATLAALDGYNVVGIFHGHQHETPMVYRSGTIDFFKPKAAYMGGFALVRVTSDFMDVALGEATDDSGSIQFTNAFSKAI